MWIAFCFSDFLGGTSDVTCSNQRTPLSVVNLVSRLMSIPLAGRTWSKDEACEGVFVLTVVHV